MLSNIEGGLPDILYTHLQSQTLILQLLDPYTPKSKPEALTPNPKL